ncbi:MAG: hypothetical protein U0703_14100 [Anaerolineae bacterium]
MGRLSRDFDRRRQRRAGSLGRRWLHTGRGNKGVDSDHANRRANAQLIVPSDSPLTTATEFSP